MKMVLAKPFKMVSMPVWLRRLASPRVQLVIILFAAALLRVNNLNWDSTRHLHPDERFLASVTNDLTWAGPGTLANYFDPNASTLSPYSLPKIGLYVYGTLPVYLVKGTAIALGQNKYDQITLLGRALSGLFDLGAIFFLFLIGRRLYGQNVGLLAALLLSLSVLNIQLSHFYTVDTFANFFVMATFFFLLRAGSGGRLVDFALAGLLFGLGLSSKISIMTLMAPILITTALDFNRRIRQGASLADAIEHSLVRLLTLLGLAALTFRLVQPIAFSGPSFWNWSLNPMWQKDLLEQSKILTGTVDLPWVQQWVGRSPGFALTNLLVWGLGLPLGLAAMAGLGLAGYELARFRKLAHLLPVTYVVLTFAYHAATFIKFMRYFLPIYPFLALLAAYLLVRLLQSGAEDQTLTVEGSAAVVLPAAMELPAAVNLPAEVDVQPPLNTPAEDMTNVPGARQRRGLHLGQTITRLIHWPIFSSRVFSLVVAALVIGGTLLYALSFSTIYSRTNTRIEASRWIYAHIPAGATLANEHWDDWLPIGGLDGKTSYGDKGQFKAVEMANYEPDTPEKLDKMVNNLSQADYLVLSSNRLYNSIPRLPVRYPMTSNYYALLLSGQLGFERIAEFTSYPTLLGIPISDQSAEESFTVYDHPRVQIFKKSAGFNADTLRQELGSGVDWTSVLQLTPRQASAAPGGLRLSPVLLQRYQQVAEWSSTEVSEQSWGSRAPVLAWVLVLLLIGVLAGPITWFIFRRFVDGGYLSSKPLGLLLVAWAAWLIASLRMAPMTGWLVLLVMVGLALVSARVALSNRAALFDFIRARWRLLLFEEALFWAFFALSLIIRLNNPDLWHPFMGGEKPMDLAYLTAITRTPFFPPYDPWFSGGYINYYYFGYVLVAVISHLTGIVPTVAYNLAVPMFFAMTALGAFAAALNLAEGWSNPTQGTGIRRWFGLEAGPLVAGICGALFVTVIGNLGQVQLLFDGVRNLSLIQVKGSPSLAIMFAQFADGFGQLMSGAKLNFHNEWWYWNATRIIPPATGEAGPINEMPFFTFLYGDLHAHMMALPYTLLVLGLIFNLLRRASGTPSQAEVQPTSQRRWWQAGEWPILALLGLTIGALRVINTWDFPTYTVLTTAGLAFAAYARRGRINLALIWDITWRIALVLGLGQLLFLPFHLAYASDYSSAQLWQGSRTPLWAYLLIHGFFLFMLTSYLAAELLGGRGHNLPVRLLRYALENWRHPKRIRRMFERLGQATSARSAFSQSGSANNAVSSESEPHPSVFSRAAYSRIAIGRTVVAGLLTATVLVVILLLDRLAGLVLGLILIAALLLFGRLEPRRRFVLFITLLGLSLTLLVEYVVLKGDISRMNTVFKFYLQVWVMWAVAEAAVLPDLAARLRAAAKASRKLYGGFEPRDWWIAFSLLLAGCLLYPLTAVPKRINERLSDRQVLTLDGSAYMHSAAYTDKDQKFSLGWDRQAIDWLQQNVRGMPVMVEANTPLYRWGSRVSIYTGLPAVIGWDWHQKQQRSILPGSIIDRRIEDVRAFYTSADKAETENLLDRYDIQYIYVGPLERIYYGEDVGKKFDQYDGQLWQRVYENPQVKIYKVRSSEARTP